MLKALMGKPSAKKPLSPFQWGLAFDAFALAAAMTGMWPYTAALEHKLTCIKIGHEARGRGLGPQLCVVYDEVPLHKTCLPDHSSHPCL